MATAEQSPGRRERNKLDKLHRITAAARELFEQYGIDDVTTQQIAQRADVGAGTIFLYARSKSELLLLVQNAAYEEALSRGIADATEAPDALDAVLRILKPIVECNRAHPRNGRIYLREMLFGDQDEIHHRVAIDISAKTERAVSDVLVRAARSRDEAIICSRVISSVVFVSLVTMSESETSTQQVMTSIEEQVREVLR